MKKSVFISFDTIIIIFSLYASFFIRFDFDISFYGHYGLIIKNTLYVFIGVKIVTFVLFRIYNFTWRYFSIYDLLKLTSAVIVSELVLTSVIYFIVVPGLYVTNLNESASIRMFPRSIVILDGIITLSLMSALRLSKRVYLEVIRTNKVKDLKSTLIIGAGNTGEMILRDIMRQHKSYLRVIGFIDDDKNKTGTSVHGIKVLGATNTIKKNISRYKADVVIIAIPSLNHRVLKDMYEQVKNSGVREIKIVPRIYDFNNPKVNMNVLEDIRIEDIIGRDQVELDYKNIESSLMSKTVLITGSCGSIGSEITMQVCVYNPNKIVLFDIDETAMHNMELSINKRYANLKGKIHYIVGNINDDKRLDDVFSYFTPDIVFHAAAYKHVPMMEHNPTEAIKVNVLGTYNVATYAAKYKAEKFIMISTDKAVEPKNVMGASKKLAEEICRCFTDSDTEFISVRFGNVLGSRGSVLPLFMEQLKEGGPLTVTHRDMERYFMTIPEAVSLVLQASIIGKNGDVIVLDMGQPVKITQLAEELIRFYGMRPYDDVDIRFIGLRPGEKLKERLLTAKEDTIATKHEKLFIVKHNSVYSKDDIDVIINDLKAVLEINSLQIKDELNIVLKRYLKSSELD
ncbi:nucleoside-diphosphate sugar epimerase [Candidatus Magnetoovum chiemensis]|nr:nucleoside-diphosphate sugar epimerase [Candidatus Magnetoovum chiemensis]